MITKEEVTKNVVIDHTIKNIKKTVSDKTSHYVFQDIEENSSKLFSDYYNKLLEKYEETFKLNLILDPSDIEKTKDLKWIDHGDYAIAYDPINKVCLMKIIKMDEEEEKMEKKELMDAKKLISLCMVYPNATINKDILERKIDEIINSDDIYNSITHAMQFDKTSTWATLPYAKDPIYHKLKYALSAGKFFEETLTRKMKEKGFDVDSFGYKDTEITFVIDWQHALYEKIAEEENDEFKE
jgi:hypothetical protein